MAEKVVVSAFDPSRTGTIGVLAGKGNALSRYLRKKSTPSDSLSRRVLSLIEERYAEPLTLTQIAESVHRSPAYLTTYLRQNTGRSVVDCLITRRMDVAKDLLITTDLSVADIGERVGYPEPSVFSRQFRRALGVSPLNWRLQERPKDWSFTTVKDTATLATR